MIPFRYVGQHSLVFEIGKLEPDDEFEIPDHLMAAFLYRPDMECMDSDAAEAFEAATAAVKPIPEPVPAPVVVAPAALAPSTKSNAKSDDSGAAASKQE